MPIKNLSNVLRLPRLGKIHLGVKAVSKGGKEYPQKTDYFVFAPELLPLVRAVYGSDKPKVLDCLIPVEDEEVFASQYYRAYSQTWGLVCKGDGETANRTVDHKTGNMVWSTPDATPEQKEIECKGPDCPEYKDKKCHERMFFQVMLPQLPGLGIWQIDTGSRNSIVNINGAVEAVRRAVGHISMVPLTLSLEPQEVKNPETGKKQAVFCLNLRIAGKLGELLSASRNPLGIEMPKPAVMPDEDGMPDVDADEEPPMPSEQWDAMKSAAKPAPVKAETPNPPSQEAKATPAAPSAESKPEKPVAQQWETFYSLTGRDVDKENKVMAQFANKHEKPADWLWKRDISRIELAQVIGVLEERARKTEEAK